MTEPAEIRVEVAFALPDRQWRRVVRVPVGARVIDAILQSGIDDVLGEVPVGAHNVGVFSRPVRLDTLLREGDRVEIYRPLSCDPKQGRRLRAKAQASSQGVVNH